MTALDRLLLLYVHFCLACIVTKEDRLFDFIIMRYGVDSIIISKFYFYLLSGVFVLFCFVVFNLLSYWSTLFVGMPWEH